MGKNLIVNNYYVSKTYSNVFEWDALGTNLMLYVLRWNLEHTAYINSTNEHTYNKLYDLFMEAYIRSRNSEDIECIGIDIDQLDLLVNCLEEILQDYDQRRNGHLCYLYNVLNSIWNDWHWN